MNKTDEVIVQISALQHFAYCPRQFSLIHIEQVWEENQYTAEGKLLHQRVDSGVFEQRKNTQFQRDVSVHSFKYKLSGKIDLLEIQTGSSNIYTPVEYKRGRSKAENWDKVQLCAQALCLEEMTGEKVNEGKIWYWQTRRRIDVSIDQALRDETIQIIDKIQDYLKHGFTPLPTTNPKRCRDCSLINICEPSVFRADQSELYISNIFNS
jgi:CRISPR-associated exonuclease Cas4